MSLVMFPLQWPWDHVKPYLSNPNAEITKAAFPSLPRAAALALAFDTWIGQPDHNDHPHNIVFGYDPEDMPASSWVFLDFSVALGWGGVWSSENGSGIPCTEAPFPPVMLPVVEKAVLDQTVAKIEAFSPDTIEAIVRGIPSTHLDLNEAEEIVAGLVARRSLVRASLAGYL